MKKLLLTTALIAVGSNAVHAGTTADAIRNSLNNIYTDYGQVYNDKTRDDGSAHGELAELAYRADNIGTFGLITIDRSESTIVGLGDSTETVEVLGNVTVNESTGLFTLAQVLEQADIFINALLDETVRTDGFIDDHLNAIIAELDAANDKITDANNGVVNPDTMELWTAEEIKEVQDNFVAYYNVEKVKFNSAVTALVNISAQVNTAVTNEDFNGFAIGGSTTGFDRDGKTYTSYTDWVVGGGTDTVVNFSFGGNTSTIDIPTADYTIGFNTIEDNATGVVFRIAVSNGRYTVTNTTTGVFSAFGTQDGVVTQAELDLAVDFILNQ